MPLHGKIVVIKRSGGDGTEFPLTASCLFGRKAECDIRIQLPHVSKEHCRIELNENKEIILTNLSSANPTRVNGEALNQSERLKHGDVISILDRSFRFECAPAPTPKKRTSSGARPETQKVLRDQQVAASVPADTREKRVSTDPHLKDGANFDNIQRSLEETLEMESQEDGTNSPFSDLYQMIKKSLDVKTPRKSSASVVQTPASKLCAPSPSCIANKGEKQVILTPKKEEDPKGTGGKTPESIKKRITSFQLPSAEGSGSREEVGKSAAASQRRASLTPQQFSVAEVIEQVTASASKSPVRRRSKESTLVKSAVSTEQEEQAVKSPKMGKKSPKNSGSAEKVKLSKKRKSEELGKDLPISTMKRKRVSFGGNLSPELFDKRLPPNSPLRKGASPRRSLSLYKPKLSLLQRASAIGLLKEQKTPSPKKLLKKSASPETTMKASPKSRSPSPAKKSPQSKSPKTTSPRKQSPRAATPSQKSPNSRSASPKAATPSQKSPMSMTNMSPATTPSDLGIHTASVQGRFSVSRIRTPSPATAVVQQTPSLPVTLKRKSMKSTSQRTPGVGRSAVKVLQRRSGISRASMKVQGSWANIVKFGQTKTSVVAPTERKLKQKPQKKIVTKLQTPARKLKDNTSTGHAASPATIVVGRAHKNSVAHPCGAAPRVVLNAALFKKDLKMDEDLTGISEMFKTPGKARRSSVSGGCVKKTPAGTSTAEPSLLNTPEDPDEMIVSPLSVTSTVKSRRYNTEAVQRLLNGDKPSFVAETSALEVYSESEPKENHIKTPSEPTVCLTGVKRIMKTPTQKAEPVEDLRGKLLKTPKQTLEQQESLTGVKRLMKTPRQKTQPLDVIRGKLLVTPKQKAEQQECLTGVKRIFRTPKVKGEPVEDLRGKLLKTPKAVKSDDVSFDGVKELLQTPNQQSQIRDLSAVVRLTRTPKENNAPVEDMIGVKRLLTTSKQKGEPVEENFGIRRLMKSPRLRENPPVEDFEGLEELMKEPLTYYKLSDAMETQPQSDTDNPVEQQQPETITADEKSHQVATCEATSSGASPEAKPIQGRRAKTVESQQQQTEELPEPPVDAILSGPAKGRRGKKPGAAAPPAVKNTRGRKAEVVEIRDVDTEAEESLPEPLKGTGKGRLVRKAQDEATEPENNPAPEEEVTSEPAVNPNEVTVEKEAPKPKRGRKPKKCEEPAPSQQNLPTLSGVNENDCSQPEASASESVDSSDAVKSTVEVSESEDKAERCKTPKKSVRGKREAKEDGDAQEAEQDLGKPVPGVRGRRGKKTEATAPPAGKLATRTRKAKSQSTVDQTGVTAQVVTENSNEEMTEAVSSGQEVSAKPIRGRKAKVTPAEPDERPAPRPETPRPATSAGQSRRGRKIKPGIEEQTEDASPPVETKQSSQPPVRAKRERSALQKEEEQINKVTSPETSEHQEPPKKSLRTRKPEQDLKPNEDIEPTEIVPEKEQASSAEPTDKLSSVAPKPRRGRKAKFETPEESSVRHAEAAEKPKRGRKVEQTPQETELGEICVPSPQVIKPSRARGGKPEVPQSIPATRGRRVMAVPLVEPTREPEAESIPVPAKRGRRAAAKPKSDDDAAEINVQAEAHDSKMSRKAVKFNSDIEIHEIPTATPAKAVRGKRAKIPDQADATGKDAIKEASKAEEENLSGDAAKPQPAKRGRRGATVPEVTAETGEQPKTRRGRSAKK